MTAAACSYNYLPGRSETDSGNMLHACDKDGGDRTVTQGSFGGNHKGDGGNVLYVDGSVRFVLFEDDDPDNATTTWRNDFDIVTGKADLGKLVSY